MNVTAPFIQRIFPSSKFFSPASALIIGRIPGLILSAHRKEALLVQRPIHRKIVTSLFSSSEAAKGMPLIYGDQCHGSEIGVVTLPLSQREEMKQVDGLMTAESEVILGITVADCAPVWIVEKHGRAGALIHSGKKGTEEEIVSKAITKMQTIFAIHPKDMIVIIGPCIRPPCYEIDFASIIYQQARELGVWMIQDEKICTACHPDRYYSYRRERGKTGHMLALLALHKKCREEDLGASS